jgi:dephospho-CoA kinase
MPLEEKRRRSSAVIRNDADLAALRERVHAALRTL